MRRSIFGGDYRPLDIPSTEDSCPPKYAAKLYGNLGGNLAAAVAMQGAHYNFCRRHSTLRMTPAMAANVTGTLWSLEDLYDRVMG